MIVIDLNNLSYRYEVYQIFNLYFPWIKPEFMVSKNACNSIGSDSNNIDNIDTIEPTSNIYKVIIEDENLFCSCENYSFSIALERDIPIKEQIKKAVFLFLKSVTKLDLPWGTLTGIRPSKIALSLLKKGFSHEEIIEYYKRHHLTHEEKAKLCIEVAEAERTIVNREKDTISVYIGMPFCPTRCIYCSFASNPIGAINKLVEPYLEALKLEIEEISKYVKQKNLKIQSLYFGGGTPTSVSNEQFEKIMKEIYEGFVYNNSIEEFTVECGRPDSITFEKLNTMKNYKVDRISINPQTMNNDTLKQIGRNHSVQDVIDKFKMARNLGFDNINMDLIVGLPGENEDHMKITCNELLKLEPDSITVHAMSVKRASKLHENLIIGMEVERSSQKYIEYCYDLIRTTANELDLDPYYMYRQKNMVGNSENIGYCRRGKKGIYNIQIIEEAQTIIALGADAITKVVFHEENRIERFANTKDVKEYISRRDELLTKKLNLLDTLYSNHASY